MFQGSILLDFAIYTLGSMDGAVARLLAFQQCGLGSILRLGVRCGLGLLLVLVLAPRGFSLGTSPQNQHVQISIRSGQPRPQALMRYRVTEGGLEPNAIVEFSRRARRVTSQLIFRRLRLGTRLRSGHCQISFLVANIPSFLSLYTEMKCVIMAIVASGDN